MTYSKSLIMLAALVAGSVPALGQAPIVVEGLPSVTVTFADLDLSSPDGQARLNSRVRRAAEQLCIEHAARDLVRSALARHCMKTALSDAHRQMEQAIAQFGAAQFAGRTTITVAGR
jgi:UrcA family protein